MVGRAVLFRALHPSTHPPIHPSVNPRFASAQHLAGAEAAREKGRGERKKTNSKKLQMHYTTAADCGTRVTLNIESPLRNMDLYIRLERWYHTACTFFEGCHRMSGCGLQDFDWTSSSFCALSMAPNKYVCFYACVLLELCVGHRAWAPNMGGQCGSGRLRAGAPPGHGVV